MQIMLGQKWNVFPHSEVSQLSSLDYIHKVQAEHILRTSSINIRLMLAFWRRTMHV